MDESNLVVLMIHEGNPSKFRVSPLSNVCWDDLEVDLSQNTWVYRGKSYAIGKPRENISGPTPLDKPVLGVYDCSEVGSVEAMVNDAGKNLLGSSYTKWTDL